MVRLTPIGSREVMLFMAKPNEMHVRASTGVRTANVKVTMVLSTPDLENVEKLQRQLGKETKSVTVGSALNIAEAVVSKLEEGCDLYERHKDGTWSKLKLLTVA